VLATMQRALVIVFAVVFVYVGASVYTEIRLIRLLGIPASEKDNPRTFEGHTFRNPEDMEIFIAEEHRNAFSPWTAPLEEWQVLLILAGSTSFIGSVVRYLVDSLNKRKKAAAGYCLLGLAIGPCLMAIAWVSETLILQGELRFRPELIAALCFLAGIFVQESWRYVSIRGRKIFGGSE
jgi:hypothetical protein